MLIFLCGCGSQGKEPSDKDAAISLQVPSTAAEEKDIPQVTVTEYPLPEEAAALDNLDLMDMGLYADKEILTRKKQKYCMRLRVGKFWSCRIFGTIMFQGLSV